MSIVSENYNSLTLLLCGFFFFLTLTPKFLFLATKIACEIFHKFRFAC